MLDSIIFCSTLALCDSLHSLLCRCTLFLSCTPTFVNWAPPANKLRVMCCVFIKNMLEKHRPIKDSVFYMEWWSEHWILGRISFAKKKPPNAIGVVLNMCAPCWRFVLEVLELGFGCLSHKFVTQLPARWFNVSILGKRRRKARISKPPWIVALII